jgi:hypothetical protein
MEPTSVFDRLVVELTAEERHDLLRKIRNSSAISDVPLYVRTEPAGEEASPIEERYNRLGVFAKFVLALKAFFSGRSPIEVFTDSLIARVAAEIERRSPGLMDPKHGVFLAAFEDEIEALKKSSRFFYYYLQASIERQRSDFYAFLASIDLEETHRRLLAETDPFAYARANPKASEHETREAINGAFSIIMGDIGDGPRAAMYRDARSLNCLKALAAVPFEDIQASFSPLSVGGPKVCYMYLIKDKLFELADILSAFKEPPSVSIVESLIVYSLQERLDDAKFDMSETLKGELERAEEALAGIRRFNERVALTDMLRFASRDLFYRPAEIPGGEDWFSIYKSFWRQRIDSALGRYLQERKRTKLVAEISEFTGKPGLDSFPNIGREGEDAIPLRQARTLAFLATFCSSVFLDDINRALKILLIEGEFYKKENLVEFTDSYNEILKLPDAIRAYDRKLAPSGEFGTPYVEALKDAASPQSRKRRMQEAIRAAEAEADGIIRRSLEALKILENIIAGVLHGEVGGRYDSVSDLGFLDGKNNKAYLKSLEFARTQCSRAALLLDELTVLDGKVFGT